MPTNRTLNLKDKLPLTCSRSGTCCHGKLVKLNPWELSCLAQEKNMSTKEFRDNYCDFGGIVLRFDGKPGWKGLHACSQYIPNFGCSVHLGRPLACRLYPLGRQKQNELSHYIYEGMEFPCLEGCPEVVNLPELSVEDYITGQAAQDFEIAQDEYLEVMQNLADIAFVLLLDSGLAESGDKQTLKTWRKMGKAAGNELLKIMDQKIPRQWIDLLMLPDIPLHPKNPISFAQQHNELLQLKIQEAFGGITQWDQLSEASCLVMGLALHLARGLGANPTSLSERWIGIAKSNGAKE